MFLVRPLDLIFCKTLSVIIIMMTADSLFLLKQGCSLSIYLLLKPLTELESRSKSSRPRPRRDIDVARPRRDRDFEQKLETRPRFERSETETRHETFETKRLQFFANIFDTKFWKFSELPNTLQYRFLDITLLY